MSLDGNGTVESIAVVVDPQPMYNLTVDEAHTFFVGDGDWLVHNDDCIQSQMLLNLGASPDEALQILRPRTGKNLDPAIISGINRPRTPAENELARQYYRNNKDYARELWERRTGQSWPTDKNGKFLPGEHTPPLKEGGHPLRVEPNFTNANAPHMIIGPDGLTDHQRWGAQGTIQREWNKKNGR